VHTQPPFLDPTSLEGYQGSTGCATAQAASERKCDEYIAAQFEAVRQKLQQVRAAIRRAVPEAVESIGSRLPGYKLHGKPMLYFRRLQGTLFAVCRIASTGRIGARPQLAAPPNPQQLNCVQLRRT